MDERRESALIKQATQDAMVEVLLALGVDVSNPEAVKEMQKDMAWVRSGRHSSERMPVYIKKAVAWAFVAAVVTWASGWIFRNIPLK